MVCDGMMLGSIRRRVRCVVPPYGRDNGVLSSTKLRGFDGVCIKELKGILSLCGWHLRLMATCEHRGRMSRRESVRTATAVLSQNMARLSANCGYWLPLAAKSELGSACRSRPIVAEPPNYSPSGQVTEERRCHGDVQYQGASLHCGRHMFQIGPDIGCRCHDSS